MSKGDASKLNKGNFLLEFTSGEVYFWGVGCESKVTNFNLLKTFSWDHSYASNISMKNKDTHENR